MISATARAVPAHWFADAAAIADMTEAHAPASYRGSETRDEFLKATGDVWIGLIERIASDEDQEAALAGYFGVSRRFV